MKNIRPDHLKTTPWLEGDDGIKEAREFMANIDAERRRLSGKDKEALSAIEAGKRREFNMANYSTLSLEELEKIHEIFKKVEPKMNTKNKTAQEIVATLSEDPIQAEAINNSQYKVKITIGEKVYAGKVNEFYGAYFFYEKKKSGKK